MNKPSYFLVCLVALVFGFACHNNPPVATVAAPPADTAVEPLYTGHGTSRDTTRRVARQDGSEEEGDDLQSIYDGYTASYTKRCVIDSSFDLGGAHYRLHAEHVCLMDSGLVVPKKYVSMYKLDSFVTHNFETRVRLEKDGKTILEQTVVKRDFDTVLDASVRRYGALFCPYLHLHNGAIQLEYSISIPLTDVGTAAYVVMDADGRVRFRVPQPADQ